ncbi:MAG: dioxygenase [Burkholderiaceae bacterium]|nr:dioxygenase [Burkholderiaceae bacterium]
MTRAALSPIFISHGSPMTALEPREAGAFMKRLGPAIDAAFGRPKAVLAVSAHTLAHAPVLLAGPQHEAVYDFGGFDDRLYTLRYDALGAPALAIQVESLLGQAGIDVHRAEQGGLDHGIWTPLRYMWPDADVPVLPLAFVPSWSPRQLFDLGAALAPLAAMGVLVMGSGSITHNLQRVFAGGARDVERAATPESTAFRDWFSQRAAAADWDALLDYRRQAPHAELMHPTDEHLLPLYVAAGAAGPVPGLRLHASLTFGELGMDAYAFGAQATALQQALHRGTTARSGR